MTFRSSKLLLAAIALGVLGACARTAPIYNVSEMPVVANKPSPSMEDVRTAIMRAGTTLGWEMAPAQPGLVVGTLKLREHTAIVDVNYTPKTYSITYKNSSNLMFDGQNIHKNYNGWIQNLDKAIRTQLSLL
jgi:hypothetical protein